MIDLLIEDDLLIEEMIAGIDYMNGFPFLYERLLIIIYQ